MSCKLIKYIFKFRIFFQYIFPYYRCCIIRRKYFFIIIQNNQIKCFKRPSVLYPLITSSFFSYAALYITASLITTFLIFNLYTFFNPR